MEIYLLPTFPEENERDLGYTLYAGEDIYSGAPSWLGQQLDILNDALLTPRSYTEDLLSEVNVRGEKLTVLYSSALSNLSAEKAYTDIIKEQYESQKNMLGFDGILTGGMLLAGAAALTIGSFATGFAAGMLGGVLVYGREVVRDYSVVNGANFALENSSYVANDTLAEIDSFFEKAREEGVSQEIAHKKAKKIALEHNEEIIAEFYSN